jgi:predicted  nucleic acid-binding Zn-ribbon protein
MPRDEDIVATINTLRQQIKQTETRLAKTEGALEAAQAAFDATEKKIRALGYEPSSDIGGEIQKKLGKLQITLQEMRAMLDDAEASLAGTTEA